MFFSLVNCRCFYLSILMIRNVMLLSVECAKFSGSHAIVSHRESCESCAIVSSCLWGYFVGPKFFLVGASWVPNFFSWFFRWSKVSSRGCFVGPKFFWSGISWAQELSRGYFVSLIFSFSWLILWFKDFRLLTGLERVTENRSITLFLSVTYSRLIGGGVCHLFLLVPYLYIP